MTRLCLCFVYCLFVNWGVQGEYVVCRRVIWYIANLIFAQYVVFTDEMYKSAVNYNAEDFPKVAVDTYPTVVIPNIREDARAEDDVKEFKYSQLEFVVCILYNFIEDNINTTGLMGFEGLYFVLKFIRCNWRI